MYNPNDKNIDLLREYFPSYNTRRFQDQPEPNVAVQDNFLKVTAQQRVDLLANPEVKVQYLRYGGSDDRQVVDLFYKEELSTQPSPLFVYIHGGYWQMLDKSHSCSMVGPLLEQGYRVAVMDYNNCPEVTLPQLMEQFTNFLLWVFDFADKTETTWINFAGHSAGAHLLAQLLHIPKLVSDKHRRMIHALFFISGVYDLRELWSLDAVNPNNIFGLTSESVVEVSPMLWDWSKDSPSWPEIKSYVIAAKNESVTFVKQSRVFAQNLEEAGFKVIFKLFEQYDHFDIIEETVDDNSPITKYITEALNGPANS